MQTARLSLVFALGSLVACSSPEFTTAPGVVGDADAGEDASVETTPDTMTPDSGPVDTTPPFTCGKPGDCTPAAKYCCADVALGAGTPPACPLTTGTTACSATCMTNIPTSCPSKGKVKLCTTKADCADDAVNPNCCTLVAAGTSGSFCMSDFFKPYTSGCL